MTITIVDPDIWEAIKKRIVAERARRLEGLVKCLPEALPREQGFIECLDWVIDLGKPPPEEPEEPIYDE